MTPGYTNCKTCGKEVIDVVARKRKGHCYSCWKDYLERQIPDSPPRSLIEIIGNRHELAAMPRIELWEHVGLGVIIPWPTGIVFTNQTGGTSCMHPELEGVFVPMCNDCTEKERVLLSPQNDLLDYFEGPRWGGSGATLGLEDQDADFIDAVLAKATLASFIRVDRSRLKDSHEAWVYVTILGEEMGGEFTFQGFHPYPRPAVLTWQNSD